MQFVVNTQLLNQGSYLVKYTDPKVMLGPYPGTPQHLHKLGRTEEKLMGLEMDLDTHLPSRFFIEPVSIELGITSQEEWNKFSEKVDLTSFLVGLVVQNGTHLPNLNLEVNSVELKGSLTFDDEFVRSMNGIKLKTNQTFESHRTFFEVASEHESEDCTINYGYFPNIASLRFHYISSLILLDFSEQYIQQFSNIKELHIDRANTMTYEKLLDFYNVGVRKMTFNQALILKVHDPHQLTNQMPELELTVGSKTYLGKSKQSLLSNLIS